MSMLLDILNWDFLVRSYTTNEIRPSHMGVPQWLKHEPDYLFPHWIHGLLWLHSTVAVGNGEWWWLSSWYGASYSHCLKCELIMECILNISVWKLHQPVLSEWQLLIFQCSEMLSCVLYLPLLCCATLYCFFYQWRRMGRGSINCPSPKF